MATATAACYNISRHRTKQGRQTKKRDCTDSSTVVVLDTTQGDTQHTPINSAPITERTTPTAQGHNNKNAFPLSAKNEETGGKSFRRCARTAPLHAIVSPAPCKPYCNNETNSNRGRGGGSPVETKKGIGEEGALHKTKFRKTKQVKAAHPFPPPPLPPQLFPV